MNDYLENLIARSFGRAETIRPRPASRFEPSPAEERSVFDGAGAVKEEDRAVGWRPRSFDRPRPQSGSDATPDTRSTPTTQVFGADPELVRGSAPTRPATPPVVTKKPIAPAQPEPLAPAHPESQPATAGSGPLRASPNQLRPPEGQIEVMESRGSSGASAIRPIKTEAVKRDVVAPVIRRVEGEPIVRQGPEEPVTTKVIAERVVQAADGPGGDGLPDDAAPPVARPNRMGLVEPLMPPSYSTAVSPEPEISFQRRSMGPDGPTVEAPAAPEKPGTIQVTIGRVEVRAVTRPSSESRKERPKPVVMSLEEYLEQRTNRGAQ